MMRNLGIISLFMLFLAACSSTPPATVGTQLQGKASYYADKYHGRLTASGTKFNQQALTAAHKSWPFGSQVRVTNNANNKSVVVTINDRGPFVRGRVIDLSKQAFTQIATVNDGLIEVTIELLEQRN